MTESRDRRPGPAVPGEAGPRTTAAIGRILSRELPVALRAARQLRARPAVLLAVLLLTSGGVIGRIVASEMMLRRDSYPGYRERQRSAGGVERQPNIPFAERWLMRYQRDAAGALVMEPLAAFYAPLRQPTHLADRWLGASITPLVPRSDEVPSWRIALLMLSVVVPTAVVGTLIFVGLVGWMRSGNRRLAVADLRHYWRAYYGPALAVALVGVAAYSVLQTPAYFRSGPAWIYQTPLAYLLFRLLMRALGVALMLAPFVVVVRGVGARKAIVEGWGLLGSRWLALVTLFALYRVGYELLNLWQALAPWPAYRSLLHLNLPGPLMWSWVHDLGMALLGLWLAYAFMEIAGGEDRPAPAA